MSLVVGADDVAGTEQRALGLGVLGELMVVAPLGDLGLVERRVGGILTGGVDGEDLGNFFELVDVPITLPLRTHAVLVAVLVRRVGQAGLVEEVLVVEQRCGVRGERQRIDRAVRVLAGGDLLGFVLR